MEAILENVGFRPMQTGDIDFLTSSWLKSYRNSTFAKNINNDDYFNYHQVIVKHLLSTCNVIIAHEINDPELIIGYIVYKDSVLHYVYTKYSFRKFGIAKTLLELANPSSDSMYVTHLHRNEDLLTKYNLKYVPYLMGV